MMDKHEHSRVTVRLELSREAKNATDKLCEIHGMKQVALGSRLVEWFCNQPDALQSIVLGVFPKEIEAEVALFLLSKRKTNTTSGSPRRIKVANKKQ